jgi:hypothetical protein
MKRREPSTTRDASDRRTNSYFTNFYFANFYFEGAAAGAADAAAAGFIAAGAAAAGEAIAAIAEACVCDFIEAFAAFFACRLQRYTLEVEMFRSLAMSFACFPLLTSFITASQSTLLVAKAGCAAAANIRVAASIDEAAASTTFFVNILVPAPVKVVFKRARLFQNARLIKRGSKSPVVGQFEFNQSLSAAYARNAPKTPMIMR